MNLKSKGLQYRDRIIFTVNILFSINYLCWRFLFTIPHEFGKLSTIAGLTLLIVEALGLVEAIIHYHSMYHSNGYSLPNPAEEEFPDVDVFVVTYNEEYELVYKTINACCHMDYPEKEKVHIYLCDDGARSQMRELAEYFGIHYLSRTDRSGAKAGNLNNALANSTSPYIATFDADMIPRSCFLMETIPYFMEADRKNRLRADEKPIELGFVQSPQSFYNPDVFQFNLYSEQRIPNEQDYFYRDIQIARTRSNSVIYGGSNTVLSRKALESVGGFYTKSITEDFATGILIQKAGYVSLAIEKPLASGLSVTDMTALIRQRIRWARGVIDSGRNLHVLASRRLSAKQKLNYWASIWYWYAPIKRLVYIMSPILYAAFGIMVVKCTLWEVLLFWLPMFLSSNAALRLLSHNIRNTRWTGVYETALFPFLLLPVLLETVGISMKSFQVSDKRTNTGRNRQDAVYMLPFALFLGLSVFGIAKCIMEMFASNSIEPIVVLFWLIGNMYYLVIALFFVDGRETRRREHRLAAEMKSELTVGANHYTGCTVNLSDSGISVRFPKPVYIPEDSSVSLTVADNGICAELLVKTVYVMEAGNGWIYSFSIQDYKDTRDDYLQLIYDRTPGLPQTLQGANGGFDDLIVNGAGRGRGVVYQKRKYPRVKLSQKVKCIQSISGNVTIEDCNYHYFRVNQSRFLPDEIEVKFDNGIRILGRKCKFRKDVFEIFQESRNEMEEVIDSYTGKTITV